MLLRFGAKNHKSICDYQEVSLAATNLKGCDEKLNVIANGVMKGQKFIPVVALYGANAAGKSNMLDALYAMDHAICSSYPSWDDIDNLPFFPCRAHGVPEHKSEVSTYDADFLIDNVRCHYGFDISASGIKKEWLYYYPAGTRRVIFFRDFTGENYDGTYYGPSMKNQKEYRDHEENDKYLLISVAKMRGNKIKKDKSISPEPAINEDGAFNFQILAAEIASKLRFVDLDGVGIITNEERIAEDLKNESNRKLVVEILQAADFGLCDVFTEEREINSKEIELHSGIAKLIKNFIPDVNENALSIKDKKSEIKFVHNSCNGNFTLGFNNESSGTKQLLALLIPIINTLKNGRTLIVDELTTALHTQLTEKIISLFSNQKINTKNAQFIFSTHDTNILSSQILRRDEIWFAEKNTYGQTSIYPLSDFKIREKDNFEKGYLDGRFGAVPYFGNIEELFKGA